MCSYFLRWKEKELTFADILIDLSPPRDSQSREIGGAAATKTSISQHKSRPLMALSYKYFSKASVYLVHFQ